MVVTYIHAPRESMLWRGSSQYDVYGNEFGEWTSNYFLDLTPMGIKVQRKGGQGGSIVCTINSNPKNRTGGEEKNKQKRWFDGSTYQLMQV